MNRRKFLSAAVAFPVVASLGPFALARLTPFYSPVPADLAPLILETVTGQIRKMSVIVAVAAPGDRVATLKEFAVCAADMDDATPDESRAWMLEALRDSLSESHKPGFVKMKTRDWKPISWLRWLPVAEWAPVVTVPTEFI